MTGALAARNNLRVKMPGIPWCLGVARKNENNCLIELGIELNFVFR